MSASSALQKAVWQALTGDPAVSALVGDRVYDVPPDEPGVPYLSFGPSSVVTERRDGFRSRTEAVQIDVWTRDGLRRQPCKAICDAVIDLLDQGRLTLDHPYGFARMDLVLARVMRDPDGITTHGVLQFEAEVTGG